MPETIKRTTGTKVAFGDVVQLSKARSKDPEADGFERYIGLEHLEPSDLKVRSWGDLADGVTFTNVFRPGQVLFGKRRAYQRKVAVADFSGVCSGDIYVLEPKSEQLIPELLPFICQSEPFYDYVISMSQGGLSPRVNWKALAKYEFVLPPLEEQGRIAEVLQAAVVNSDRLRGMVDISLTLREAALKEHFPIGRPKWSVMLETNLEEIINEVIDYRGRTPTKTESGVPLITAKNVRVGFVDPEPREFIAEEEFDSWMTRGLPSSGDVLFTTEAPLSNVAMVPEYKFALAQRVLLLRPDQAQLSPRFLFWMLQGPALKQQIWSRATGSTAKGIKQSSLRKLPVMLPCPKTQQEISSSLDAVAHATEALLDRTKQARALVSTLTRRFLK